jgi:hypothetical protein
MKCRISFAMVLALSIVGTFSDARAAIIERDFYSAGDGLLTYDTVNQREWLDVIATYGITQPQLDDLLIPDGPLAGFELGSFDDVKALLVSAGFDPLQIPGDQDFETAVSFIETVSGIRAGVGILGVTYYTSARIQNPTPSDSEDTVDVYAFGSESIPGALNRLPYATNMAVIDNTPFQAPALGYWVYREVAPEPGTIASGTTALAAVALSFRRRRSD